jgi:hypothetical protein
LQAPRTCKQYVLCVSLCINLAGNPFVLCFFISLNIMHQFMSLIYLFNFICSYIANKQLWLGRMNVIHCWNSCKWHGCWVFSRARHLSRIFFICIKVKFSLCLAKHHAMKTYWGWNYSTTHSWPRHKKEVCGQLHTRSLYPRRKGLRYPLDRRLGGSQSQSGRGGEENISSPRRESNPDRPARTQSLHMCIYTHARTH